MSEHQRDGIDYSTAEEAGTVDNEETMSDNAVEGPEPGSETQPALGTEEAAGEPETAVQPPLGAEEKSAT